MGFLCKWRESNSDKKVTGRVFCFFTALSQSASCVVAALNCGLDRSPFVEKCFIVAFLLLA